MVRKLQLQWVIGLIAILTVIISTTTMAQRALPSRPSGLPAYYPANYQQTGVIHDVGLDDTLIISGLKYEISPATKIHTAGTKFATTWALKTSEEVGFSFTTDTANKRHISEIWLLPKGSIVLH